MILANVKMGIHGANLKDFSKSFAVIGQLLMFNKICEKMHSSLPK